MTTRNIAKNAKPRLSMKLLWKYHLYWDKNRTEKGHVNKYPCECAGFLDFVEQQMNYPLVLEKKKPLKP